MTHQIEILEATEADAHALAEIQTQTWLTNYPNPELGITKEDIIEKTNEWRELGDERNIAILKEPNIHTWVAKVGDVVVGFIGVQIGDSENLIDAIHILPKYQNEGIGTKLLTVALTWLGSDKKISLEVVSYNKGAIRLYKKFGFISQDRVSADIITLPSGKIIPKIVMVKE